MDNGMAYLLGAADPDADASGLVPEVSRNGIGLVLTFSCLNAADRGAAVLNAEWSNDLGETDLWSGNLVAVPESSTTANGVIFTVTRNGELNVVTATIPESEGADGKLVDRLSGTEN